MNVTNSHDYMAFVSNTLCLLLRYYLPSSPSSVGWEVSVESTDIACDKRSHDALTGQVHPAY